MDLNIDQKVFLVTGGASGIGLAIAASLSLEGAIPVILDKNPEALEKALLQVPDAFALETDLREPDNCKEAIELVLRQYDRIDGLVNNAGMNDGVGLENGAPEAFWDSLHKNLGHYYYMSHYALPALKNTRGSIVNISSKTAETGQGGTSGYAASKGAINALTREWAVELAPFQIRVNAVIPAEVLTPLYEWWIHTFPDPEAKLEAISSRIPLGRRMTTAWEVAQAVLFLLSDVSSHTTGQLLHVDGGYVHLDRSM